LGFGVGEGGVLFEGLYLLVVFVLEKGEVSGFEIVDWVLMRVGDDYVYDDELGVGFEGGDRLGGLRSLGGSCEAEGEREQEEARHVVSGCVLIATQDAGGCRGKNAMPIFAAIKAAEDGRLICDGLDGS
jgi:hypothetical protein